MVTMRNTVSGYCNMIQCLARALALELIKHNPGSAWRARYLLELHLQTANFMIDTHAGQTMIIGLVFVGCNSS